MRAKISDLVRDRESLLSRELQDISTIKSEDVFDQEPIYIRFRQEDAEITEDTTFPSITILDKSLSIFRIYAKCKKGKCKVRLLIDDTNASDLEILGTYDEIANSFDTRIIEVAYNSNGNLTIEVQDPSKLEELEVVIVGYEE